MYKMDRSEEDFSVFVSNTLDTMGYSSGMIRIRREKIAERVNIVMNFPVLKDLGADLLIVGSRGEGVSRIKESDMDGMLVIKNQLCVEDMTDIHAYQRCDHLFQMDRRFTAPGYTRLSPLQDEEDLVMSNEGIWYLFNSTGIATAKGVGVSSTERQGPSLCKKLVDGTPFDYVRSIPCRCPSLLDAWLARHRHHAWPSGRTQREISTLEAHVVPAGFSRSYEQAIEWRICYTQAELALIRSLNDTQAKVYRLLKFLSKSVLKQACDAMTSYVMKNVILWISEFVPASKFTADLLIDRLVCALRLLAIAVERGCLPNYMIPERNLLLGKLHPAEKKRLLSLLSDLIEEGGNMLLRCEQLTLSMVKMYKTPDIARQEGEQIDKLESFMLSAENAMFSNIHWTGDNPLNFYLALARRCLQSLGGEDDVLSALFRQAREILLPDIQQLRDRGEDEVLVMRDRYFKLLPHLS